MKKKNYGAPYPNGYMPKIAYYQAKISMAVDALEIHNIKFYTTKLEYFLGKQVEVNGRLAQLVD